MLANASSSSDGGHPGKRRLSGEERRQAIVEAAVRLFSERGFRGTTTRELAAAVGVTEPILYQHFATKRDLYTAMVDWLIEQKSRHDHTRLKALSEGVDDRAFFYELGLHMLDFTGNSTDAIRLLIISALEGHELSEIWHERINKEFRCFVETYLERRTREGALRALDPILVSRAFMGMVAHYGMMTLIMKGWEATRSREETVDCFVDLLLNGLKG